jgi:hypothetical protein
VWRVDPAENGVASELRQSLGPRLHHVDAYACRRHLGETADPRRWARALFTLEAMPAPVRLGVRLRDGVVRPFGLRAMGDGDPLDTGFPELAASPNCLLLGVDDAHLVFRVILRVSGGVTTVATGVRLVNLLGRIYWAPVRVAHSWIVPYCLARVNPGPASG